MSTAARPQDARVRISQLLVDRAAKQEELQTKTYVDEPKATAVGPDGSVYVAMQSGRVWRFNGAHWQSVGWAPLPDTTARESYDEYTTITRDLKALGHVEED